MTAWTLIPGSDTPGDRIEPMQLVGEAYDNDIYACLITAPQNGDQGIPGGWYLAPLDTAWTATALAEASVSSPAPAGVYVGVYSPSVGSVAPSALPVGWLPVEGPKFCPADDRSYAYFAGRVQVAADTVVLDVHGVPAFSSDWMLLPDGTPLTQPGLDGATSLNSQTLPAGYYVAAFYAPDLVPPTAWPTQLTPAASVCGPVAITDENAGAVIGDIAYVVSGYVYNSIEVYLLQHPERFIGEVGLDSTTELVAGDVFLAPGSQLKYVRASGTLILDADGNVQDGTTVSFGPYVHDLDYWPYLERFDLTTKKWLLRIKLPLLPQFAYTPPGVKTWFAGDYSAAGPYDLEAGSLEPSTRSIGSLRWLVTHLASDPDLQAEVNASTQPEQESAPYPAGRYWVITGEVGGAESAQELGDSLAGVRAPDLPYAAEGGFAGAIDGKLYFGGGDSDSITGSEFFSYDPATQTFERLDDCPVAPDYCPFGAVGTKLWVGTGAHVEVDEEHFTSEVVAYDTVAGTWGSPQQAAGAAPLPGDQIQGVEIGGKLYFVYDRVYVFDPVALTVEAKAAAPVLDTPAVPFLVGSKIGVTSSVNTDRAYDIYDPVADSWASGPHDGLLGSGYSTAVFYQGSAYLLSGISNNIDSTNMAGVCALLGSAYTAPPVKHLTHLGFAPRQAAVLQSDPAQLEVKHLIRAGFSYRQAKTLKRGDRSLKALIRGGFPTYQARALEDS